MAVVAVAASPIRSHDERTVMQRYARGEEIPVIAEATGCPRNKVVDLVTNVAKFDRGRARAAVLAYDAARSTPQGRLRLEAAQPSPKPKPKPSKPKPPKAKEVPMAETEPAATPPEPPALQPAPVTVLDGVDELLAQAEKSPVAAAVKLAKRIRELVAELTGVMAHTEKERELLERKAQLRQEMDALDAELRNLKDTSAKAAKVSPLAVRQWARANGIECPGMGPIPKEIQVQYDAAHQSQP